jgi:hypothetical protein
LEEDIAAYADFIMFQQEGTYTATVHIQRKGTVLEIEDGEIRSDPLRVTVSIEEKLTKSHEVLPSLRGVPGAGHELGQYIMTPSVVEAVGPRSIMEQINSLGTEDIQLSGRQEDFSERVRLVRGNNFIDLPGGDVVELRGFIREALQIQTFVDVEVIEIGGASDLESQGLQFSNSIRIQGKYSQLELLNPDDIKMIVDVKDAQAPGLYILPTRPSVPIGLIVLQYTPEEVELNLVQSKTTEGEGD